MPTFRRFTETDIDSLAVLVATVEAADEGVSRTLAEIQADLETATAGLTRSGWLAQVDKRQVVGYNYLETVSGPEGVNFWLRGAVHPHWRGQGLGQELIHRSWTDMGQQRAQFDDQLAWVNA